jgi:hypothetical protein
MRLTGDHSVSTRVRAFVDSLLILALFGLALETCLALTLLANPYNPLRKYFQVTTILKVSERLWPAADLVRVADGSTTVTAEPMAYVTFQPGSRWFVLATFVASLSVWACYILVLLQLRGVCANFSSGPPFLRDNIRRMRLMGWAFIGSAAADLLIDASAVVYQRALVTVAGEPPSIPGVIWLLDFPLGTILAGLAVIVLAEIFRAGADLQDEQALTI